MGCFLNGSKKSPVLEEVPEAMVLCTLKLPGALDRLGQFLGLVILLPDGQSLPWPRTSMPQDRNTAVLVVIPLPRRRRGRKSGDGCALAAVGRRRQDGEDSVSRRRRQSAAHCAKGWEGRHCRHCQAEFVVLQLTKGCVEAKSCTTGNLTCTGLAATTSRPEDVRRLAVM